MDDFATENAFDDVESDVERYLGLTDPAHASSTTWAALWATRQVWELTSSVRSLRHCARCQFSLRPQVCWRNVGIVTLVLRT